MDKDGTAIETPLAHPCDFGVKTYLCPSVFICGFKVTVARRRFWQLLLAAVGIVIHPALAWGRHLARLDPTEPIFTQRAFVETNLELDTTWDKLKDGNAVELAPGVSWVFWQQLELDAEIPVGVRIPDRGATVGSLADIALGAQWLLCCGPNGLLDYFSVRGDVAPPTGSRGKDIGGTGSWSVSLLPGRRFTIAQALP